MATPPSKRDQRREERKASIAGNQAAHTSSSGRSGTAKSAAAKPAGGASNAAKAGGSTSQGSTQAGKGASSAKTSATTTAGNARVVGGGAQDGSTTKRDQRREARVAQFQERRAERQRQIQAAKTREAIGRLTVVGGFVVLIALILLILHFATSGSSHPPAVSSGYGRGITCDTGEGSAAHYHANLQIIVNGKDEPVPAGVGIVPNQCLYWLHTHDTSGVIHIETPDASRTYYLGDFFAVWSKTVSQSGSIALGSPALSTTSFFGHPVDADHPLTIYINGQIYQGDPNQIAIRSGENIWLEYGKPLVTPTPYNFAANGVSP
jgi:hypothetical protein